uniref:FAM161 centrosomal protein B n=1 Tax=Oncorhynchus mykiss TaxID=8022 RepID=A0A8K9UXS8_ONCMY
MSTGSLVLQDLPTGQAIVEVYHILCSLGIRHNCHTERTTATSASRPTETEQHQLSKEEKEDAECQRKFRAVPVLVQRERKEGHEQRKDFMPSMQKPFSFLERDEKKREKLMEKEELRRMICIQPRAQENLRKSTAPIENQTHTENPEPHSFQHTKKEVLAFLDQTTSQVPDFDRLHKAFHREALRRAERKYVTKCQPFHLRTSTLPSRTSRSSSEKEQVISAFLKRSNSFGGLTSLSTDTLPTYITDAARKRCMAIRESTEQESAEFMRKHRMMSQAMKKTVAVRAKVMDPHSSLKESCTVFLYLMCLWLCTCSESEQQRMKEYKKELQDMKTRVTDHPYLFEQVATMQREAGLNESLKRHRSSNLMTIVMTKVLRVTWRKGTYNDNKGV